jgi:hypothetical protein
MQVNSNNSPADQGGHPDLEPSSGVGVFFSRQDDRPGASNKQLVIAAWIGKRRCWVLGQWMLYVAGSKL